MVMEKKVGREEDSRGCGVNDVTWRFSLSLVSVFVVQQGSLCLASPMLQRFTDSAFNCDQPLNDLSHFWG